MKTLIILLALFTVTVYMTEACRCFNYSPQRSACSKSLVVKAKLISKTGQSQDPRTVRKNIFKFETLEILKGSIGKKFEVKDRLAGTSCSVSFTEGKEYLLTGTVPDSSTKEVQLNACDFHREWQYLTEEHKQGFRGLYYQQC